MGLIIFSGITGFDKTEFIRSFALKCLEKHHYPVDLENSDSRKFIHYIKFEDVLLDVADSADIANFLGRHSLHEKNNAIEQTFSRIGKQIEETRAEHVFLDIHLCCLYHSQFFPPLSAANLNELDRSVAPFPEASIKVVALIDNVYSIWRNLKNREATFPGTSLRLREILAWRSVELLQAEAVALNYTSETRDVRNYLFSVRHPFISIYNLVFSENPICVYLSFPITNTRQCSNRIDNINIFRRRMYEMATELGVVVFDPVTIDELALNFSTLDGENRVLNGSMRWPLDTEDLLVAEPHWPIEIPDNEVEEVRSDIMNNIRPRDFKLIDNSMLTTVYRKNYGGHSRGVTEEITYANSRGKRVYVYDPEEDAEAGVSHPFDPDVYGYRDVEAFYDAVKKGIESCQVARAYRRIA